MCHGRSRWSGWRRPPNWLAHRPERLSVGHQQAPEPPCEHVAPSPSIRYKGRVCERAQRVGEGGELSEITTAITARQAQIKQLQSDIESLQRAASVLGGGTTARAKAVSQPKPKRSRKAKAKPKTTAKPKPKARAKAKPHQWTVAEKAAIGRRMKAYWAKRRKAKG